MILSIVLSKKPLKVMEKGREETGGLRSEEQVVSVYKGWMQILLGQL